MASMIQSVKGTREFYPEDMAIRTWLYGIIRQVSEAYGHQEFEAPFLEKIELYAAKSGEELVKEQAFVFPDRGGEYITLRPELTPSLARMVAQRQKELVYPLRWWSFGPFWRYERPQKGRTREFFQWNIDIIGANSPEADADLVSVAANFFIKVGFTSDQVKIKVNSRKLMEENILAIGVDRSQIKSVFKLIDSKDKMGQADWETSAHDIGLTADQFRDLQVMLNDADLWKKSTEMVRFFDALSALGVLDYVQYDSNIVRGLDYYTGVVFEAQHIKEGGRAILGGGRYDNLVQDVGGETLTGVGFAMGDVLITLLLKKYELIPTLPTTPTSILITVFDEERVPASFSLAMLLRNAGLNCTCYPEVTKLPKQLKYADRIGARFVLIIGPDEAASGNVTVKDLQKRTQITVAQKELPLEMRKLLDEDLS
jgi:histidyl-tRNA synthetase